MNKLLSLVVVCMAGLGMGCTGENPDYCDESKPCAPGYACHLPTNSCHPVEDGGGDATADTRADTTSDVPWGDMGSDSGVDVIQTPDLEDDSMADIGADLGADLGVDTVKKANGVACAGNTECTSGICHATEKVCCDKACAGACESCVLASKKGTCSLKAANTVCGAADKCVDGASSSYIEKHRCDGKVATCAKTTAACTAPYKCASATACATSCKDNGGCTTGLCDLYDKKNTCPKASDICFVDAKSSGGSGTQASPYDTINKCLATSKVYVSIAAGTYQEALSINKKVLLVAAGVQASPFAGGTPTVKLTAKKPVIKINSGSEVYLYGFDVTTPSGSDADMVTTTTSTKTTVSHSVFHHSFAWNCIFSGLATHLSLEDVRFNNCGTGLQVEFGPATLSKVKATNNGIGLWIEGNGGTDVYKCEDLVATGNSGIGIAATEAKSMVIDRVITSGNSGTGLFMDGNLAETVTNLLSTGNKIGVERSSCYSTPCSVINATIADNQQEEVKCSTPSSGYPTFINSIVWDNSGVIYSGSCGFEYSDVKGLSSGSGGSINLDPAFTNAPFDYTIKASSPCKNMGSTIGITLPAKDLAGKTRVVGASVDMGAYEVQ